VHLGDFLQRKTEIPQAFAKIFPSVTCYQHKSSFLGEKWELLTVCRTGVAPFGSIPVIAIIPFF